MLAKTRFTLIPKSSFAFPLGANEKHWGVGNFPNYKYYTTSTGGEIKDKQTKNFGERKVCVDGIHLNVREEGEGSHNVLCLPGLVGTIETDFGPIFKTMDTSKFRLICWDPPGYGKSRPPNRKHARDFYLDDAKLVARLMDGYRKYSVLGWSNGGVTGYTLASLFPQRVTHLVTWGAVPYMDDQIFRSGHLLRDTKNWSPKMLKVAQNIYEKEYLETTLADWGRTLKEFILSGEQSILQERISKIQCPIFIVHGLKDNMMTMRHVYYLMKQAKDCKVRIFLRGRHDVHLTHCAEFVKEVESFLLSPSK